MPIDHDLSDHLVHVTDPNLGLNSIWRWHLTSIWNLIVVITRWYDRLISMMEFSRLKKKHFISNQGSVLYLTVPVSCSLTVLGHQQTALTKACGMPFSNTFSLIIHRYSKTLSCDITLLLFESFHRFAQLKTFSEAKKTSRFSSLADESLKHTKIVKFMGPIWGPPGSCRPQMGPMLAHEPCYQGNRLLQVQCQAVSVLLTIYSK